MTFDLSGHGQSAVEKSLGDLTRRDHLNDAVAAYDSLVREGEIDPTRVGVFGASYGAYLASLLASRRTVKRLLLRAPALYDDSDFVTPLRVERKTDAHAVAPLVFDSLRTFRGELLVVESEDDEVVPHAVVDRYSEAVAGSNVNVIAGATHVLTDPRWKKELMRMILGWFAGL